MDRKMWYTLILLSHKKELNNAICSFVGGPNDYHTKWSQSEKDKISYEITYVLCLVAQLCQTLCVPMDCSLPGFSVHGDSPGKNIGVNCHALLQGIFSIQGSNPTLPHCSWILYCLNYQRSPRKLEWVAYPFFLGIISIQELNRSLLHCRQILYQLSYQGSLISLICGI